MSLIETILLDAQNVDKAELRGYLEAREVKSIKDYGAAGDGVTDDITAIQAALDDLDDYDSLFIPPGVYIVSGTLLLPKKSGLSFFGAGMLASRIRLTGGTTTTDVFARADPSELDTNAVNHWTFRDFGIDAIGSSRHGISWLSICRSQFSRLYFDNLGGAAIRMQSSLAVTGRDFRMGACAYGILQENIGWTGLNGLHLSGYYITTMSAYGIKFDAGLSKFTLDGVAESCALGGIWLGQDCEDGYIRLFGEENKTALTSTQDIYIGATADCKNIVVERSYLNGDTGATDFHYPIRMKYATNCRIEGISVTTGNKFIHFVTGGSLAGNEIGAVTLSSGSYVPLNQSQPTYNFGTDMLKHFVNGNNKLLDPTFAPFIQNNVLRKRLPYGGWTTTVAGTSSLAKSNVDIGGSYAVRMIRGTGACEFSLVVTIGPEFRNRFCVFVVPILPRVADMTIDVSVTPDGTNPTGETLSLASLPADVLALTRCAAFVPSDAGTLTIAVTGTENGGDFDIGHPCLYVGAQPWYSADGADPFWEHTAAPTAGTWVDRDWVRNSAPASGGTPGWVCTTPGAAGVFAFSAEANLS